MNVASRWSTVHNYDLLVLLKFPMDTSRWLSTVCSTGMQRIPHTHNEVTKIITTTTTITSYFVWLYYLHARNDISNPPLPPSHDGVHVGLQLFAVQQPLIDAELYRFVVVEEFVGRRAPRNFQHAVKIAQRVHFQFQCFHNTIDVRLVGAQQTYGDHHVLRHFAAGGGGVCRLIVDGEPLLQGNGFETPAFASVQLQFVQAGNEGTAHAVVIRHARIQFVHRPSSFRGGIDVRIVTGLAVFKRGG